MNDFEIELKKEFLDESEDLLESAESAFLSLEIDGDNSEVINEIFRLAHNLKGTSKAVGFGQMAELTHVAENLVLKLKENEIKVTDAVITVLLEFKDKVSEMIEALKEDLDAKVDIDLLIEKLDAKTEEKVTYVNTNINQEDKSEEISNAALESLLEMGMLESEIAEITQTALADEDNPKEKIEPLKSKNKKEKSDESIRVNLERINNINNVVGELVILQTSLYQRRFEHIQDDLSNSSIGLMGKLFKELQELAMSLRMLPIKSMFQKMNRIVRDTSKLLDKNVKLHLVGEETEVDKTVLELLGDPLVHIVRNSVDHGLENKTERVESGKEVQGNVELMAYHEGSNLIIQITDDGKGIDHEVIYQKAIEKGVINTGVELSQSERLQLIFHPGFSTAEKLTDVSGRGVGLDVVKTNIELLGGEVKLMSKKGEGTSFKIMLPLTMAIIEGLVIKSDEENYVLPLNQVNEIAQIKQEEIQKFSKMANLFTLRGEVLPLFYLNHKFTRQEKDIKNITVIVIRGMGFSYGVVVDDILYQQQIVIKKIGEDVQNKPWIMGCSIMADGRPSIILDFIELFKKDLSNSKTNQAQKNVA